MRIIKLSLKNKNFKIKQLFEGRLNKTGGRNNHGKITLRSRGGGAKQMRRLINFQHLLWNIPVIILTIEYSVKRSNFISLVCYLNGILAYFLTTEGVKIGTILNIGLVKNNLLFEKGCVHFLNNLVDGMIVHSLELKYLRGAIVARAAGTSAQIIKANYKKNKSLIKFPSGEEHLVNNKCIAVIGQVSNKSHFLKHLRKAGQTRNLGIRSHVRGVAMNPIDHPHGGGQGKTSGAGGRRSQVTFKGKPAKGQPTRSKRKISSFILVYRNKKRINH